MRKQKSGMLVLDCTGEWKRGLCQKQHGESKASLQPNVNGQLN